MRSQSAPLKLVLAAPYAKAQAFYLPDGQVVGSLMSVLWESSLRAISSLSLNGDLSNLFTSLGSPSPKVYHLRGSAEVV